MNFKFESMCYHSTQATKAFFVERGHQVAETFVERGYDPEEEVRKHVAARASPKRSPINYTSQ